MYIKYISLPLPPLLPPPCITARGRREEVGLSFIKNKAINGVRLEASGRLTRRLTASRSISKLEYNSKTPNGAYGLKVWVSSY